MKKYDGRPRSARDVMQADIRKIRVVVNQTRGHEHNLPDGKS
jgi:hypothetical protein